MLILCVERMLAMRERLPGLLSFSIMITSVSTTKVPRDSKMARALRGITYDHANDRVVDGVRNGESVNIDTIRGQRVANFRERSGFVGQKYR